MVRAALSGAIDFSKADPNDSWWWKRTEWILEEIAGKEQREVLSQHHQYWLALIGCPAVNRIPKGASSAMEGASHVLDRLTAAYWPWADDGDMTRTETDILEAYYAEFGQPGSEKYEQMMQAAREGVAALNAKNG